MTPDSLSEAPEAVRIARWIEHDDVQRLRNQGAQFVDVLDEEAFEKAHITGSINIPLKRIRGGCCAPRSQPPDRPVLL